MAASIVLGAIALGTGIYGMIKSSKEKKKAEAALKNNVRPDFNIPKQEFDNQRLIESMAGQGLSDKSKNYAEQQYARGLNSTINAIAQGGGRPQDVTKAYRAYNDAVDRLALMDEDARIRNVNSLISQNRRMSGNEVAEWQIDEYAPYQDRNALYSKMYGIADQNYMSSLGMAGQGVGTIAGGASRMSATNRERGGNVNSQYGGSNATGSTAYAPQSNPMVNQIAWERIRPESRNTLYQMYNNPTYYG